MYLKGVIHLNTRRASVLIPKVSILKMAHYPWNWMVSNKGIILKCENDLICIVILDISSLSILDWNYTW